MSVRTRLILAFLLVSVVPLTAVTLFSYASSVRAFERAAEHEAARGATDFSRRMEMVAADVGQRLDTLFATTGASPAGVDPDAIRERVAPLLGDAVTLLDRLEFHPTGRTPPPAPDAPGAAGVPPVQPPPVVIDVPSAVQESRHALREALTGLPPELEKQIARGIEAGLSAADISVRAVAGAIARQSAAQAKTPPPDLDGRRVEVRVERDGQLLGRANAMLNMERTLRSVLAFARLDPGDIPFAIDSRGQLFAADPAQLTTLAALDVGHLAPDAASGKPQRVNDWIVVAERDRSGVIFGIARPIGESLREIRRASVRNLALGLLVIGLAIVGIVPLSHRMTQNLRALSDGVRRLAGGDFRARVDVRSADEFGALARSFNQMAQDIERHELAAVERERLRQELEFSRLVQAEMLPGRALVADHVEIRGRSVPAREIGGDFFNYFTLPDGRVVLLLGDVSGKGVSAALLMANLQATLRARIPVESGLAALADALDREFELTTPAAVFATLFVGVLDADGRTLRYVNAGHHPPLLVRKPDTVTELGPTGLPIALFAGHGYREASIAVAPGDLLFVYSDGLVELEDPSSEMLGPERLRTFIVEARHEPLQDLLGRIETSADAFRGGTDQLDDLTMMAMRVRG